MIVVVMMMVVVMMVMMLRRLSRNHCSRQYDYGNHRKQNLRHLHAFLLLPASTTPFRASELIAPALLGCLLRTRITAHKSFPQHIPHHPSTSLSPSATSISTSTSAPSTFNGYTRTLPVSGASASPVSTSNAHACQGHITAPSSIHPAPSGPCRCGQTFPIADNVPSTLAKQIGTPLPSRPTASASLTSSVPGASPTPHNRTHSPTSFSSKLHSTHHLDQKRLYSTKIVISTAAQRSGETPVFCRIPLHPYPSHEMLYPA